MYQFFHIKFQMQIRTYLRIWEYLHTPSSFVLDRKRKQKTQKNQCWCLACIELLCYMEKVGLQPSHHKTNIYMNPHTTFKRLPLWPLWALHARLRYWYM